MIDTFTIHIRILHFILVFGRIGGFLFALPFLVGKTVPMRFRSMLAVASAVVLLPTVPEGWGVNAEPALRSLPMLILLMMSEMALGLVAALIVRMVLEAITLGGAEIGRNMGFAFAKQVDPSMNMQASIISVAFGQAFAVLLLIWGVHYDLLRIAARSIQTLPPGVYVPNQQDMQGIMHMAMWMFVTAFKMALPVIFIIMIVNVAMALMTKFGQEFQVMMLAFPIRIGLGFLILSSFPIVFLTLSRSMTQEMFLYLERLIGL